MTRKKDIQQKLGRLEWLLEKRVHPSDPRKAPYAPPYGDVTALNTCRVILDAVGKETLKQIAEDAIDLLDTSVAIYEVNGDYAFGIFSSGWCRVMDAASRTLCETDDNQEALRCGKWLCHENCWNDSAKAAIQSGHSTDIPCVGAIHLYAEPIYAGEKVVGAINIGYGDPPTDSRRLKSLAERFGVDMKRLRSVGEAYASRPRFIVDVAKKRLKTWAKLIGDTVEKAGAQKVLAEAQTRERHLSSVLRAIRNVNQLITHEKHRERLTEKICHSLVETRGYFNAWIVLLDHAGHYQDCSEAGLDGHFLPLKTQLKKGRLTACARKALKQNPVIATAHPSSTCQDCPLGSHYQGRAALTVRLSHNDQVYGLLSVSIPKKYADDPEEQDLFKDVADDIGFALHNMIQEEHREAAEQALRQSREQLSLITNSVSAIIAHIDGGERYLFANETFRDWYGVDPRTVIGRHVRHVMGEAAYQHAKPFIDKTLKGEAGSFDLKMDKPDGGVRYARVNTMPHIDDEGKVNSYFVVSQDITALKETEQRLRKSEKALSAAKRSLEDRMRALLFPAMHPGRLRMTDVLSRETLNGINKAFAEVFDVTMLLTDAEGNYITEPHGLSQFCRLIRKSQTGLERCKASDDGLARQVKAAEGPIITRCSSAGLMDAALPIRIGGRHVASWLVGQFCPPELNEKQVRKTADEIGVDAEALIAAYHNLKQRPVEHMENALKMLDIFTREISEYGLSNLKLARAVQERKTAEDRLNLALQGADLGTWDWAIETAGVQFNPRWAEMKGYTLDELSPHLDTWKELVHPDDLPDAYDRLNAHLSGRTPSYEAEFRMRHKSGNWVWILDKGKVIEWGSDGKPLRACGTHLDITQRKRAELALQKSEQEKMRMLKSMLNAFAIFESVFDRDDQFVSYRFVYINDAYERITGVKNEAVKGKTIHEVWPATEPEWIQRYGEVAVTGKSRRFELYHDPTKKFYDCNVYRPFDTREMFCVIFEDITKRKQTERELSLYREDLEFQVARRTAELKAANQELESFVYSVSHDLRAPLRSITGFAEIIARRHREDLNAEGRHYFDNIVEAGNRMGDLIHDLLSFSRLGKKALSREPVALSPILEKIRSEFEAKEAGASAAIHIQEGLPPVRGVRTFVSQVFTNLMDNALKYRREGVPPRVEITGTLEGEWAVLSVADNGLGIAPEHQEKIFNIFQRLHGRERYSGTGVGLAIVKKAVELMGGSVALESQPGQGSTFRVRLPAG